MVSNFRKDDHLISARSGVNSLDQIPFVLLRCWISDLQTPGVVAYTVPKVVETYA
jgi:hypothetical protein